MNYFTSIIFISLLSIINGFLSISLYTLDCTNAASNNKIILIKTGLVIQFLTILIFGIINIFKSNTFKIILTENEYINQFANSYSYAEQSIQHINLPFYMFMVYTIIVTILIIRILFSYLAAYKQLYPSTRSTLLGHTVFLNKNINSPLCFGIPKGKIYFPSHSEKNWSTREIELSLTHEKIHQAQNDPFWKLFSLILRSFLFFAPWSYILHRRFELEMEIFCDESTRHQTQADINEYSHLLLFMLNNQHHNHIHANLKNSNLKRRFIAMKSKNITRPFLSTVLSFVILLTAGAVIASTNSIPHGKIFFDTGDSYELTINNDSLIWKGLTGEDKGIISKNRVKHLSLSKDTELFQWTDNKTGVFVTFILDKKNHQGICSSKGNNQQWLTRGKVVFN